MKHNRVLSASLALLLAFTAAGFSGCGTEGSSYTRGAYIRVVSNEEFAPLRKKPKENADILANLPADLEITLLGKENDGWYEAEWNGIRGYLAERYITYTAHTSVYGTTTTEDTQTTSVPISTVKISDSGTTVTSTSASVKTSVWSTRATTSTTLRTSKTHIVTTSKAPQTQPTVTPTQTPVSSSSDTPAPVNSTSLQQTETTAAPTPSLRVGTIVPIGRYEQDNDWNNGAETLCWLIIGETSEGYLLLAENAILVHSYNDDNTAVTWETSSLRSYLNGDFLYDAFNADERAMIAVTNLINESNPVSGVSGGSNTLDHVFLLSLGEAESYLADSSLHAAEPSAYALAHGAQTDEDGLVQWWLRSPGGSNTSAAVIPYDQAAMTEGLPVTSSCCVRPCIILKK